MSNQSHPIAGGAEARALFPKELPPSKQFYCALPCYGSMMTQPFVMSLTETLLQSPFIGRLDFVLNDSLVSRARNTLVARFLDSDYQWLIFLDVDLQFKVEHIARLWLHATKEGRDIVCGMYAMKKLAPRFVANYIAGEKPDANGAVRVTESGTGCMVIHRRVFEKMREAMPEIAYTTDMNHASGPRTEWDFFAVGPYRYKSGLVRYLSEDWMFCQRARDLGFEVWVDTQIQIRHMGTLVYPPMPDEVSEAVQTYVAMGANGMEPELVEACGKIRARKQAAASGSAA